MNAPRRIALACFAVMTFATMPLEAGSASATMQVSVQVIARAIVNVDSQPSTVDVTAADIARGYVDVPSPIVVRVRTNSRQGYMLQVENMSETFSSVELSNGEVAMNVGSQESWIQRPYIAGGDVMPLRARLRLSPAATPGTVALGIAFNASPL